MDAPVGLGWCAKEPAHAYLAGAQRGEQVLLAACGGHLLWPHLHPGVYACDQPCFHAAVFLPALVTNVSAMYGNTPLVSTPPFCVTPEAADRGAG